MISYHPQLARARDQVQARGRHVIRSTPTAVRPRPPLLVRGSPPTAAEVPTDGDDPALAGAARGREARDPTGDESDAAPSSIHPIPPARTQQQALRIAHRLSGRVGPSPSGRLRRAPHRTAWQAGSQSPGQGRPREPPGTGGQRTSRSDKKKADGVVGVQCPADADEAPGTPSVYPSDPAAAATGQATSRWVLSVLFRLRLVYPRSWSLPPKSQADLPPSHRTAAAIANCFAVSTAGWW